MNFFDERKRLELILEELAQDKPEHSKAERDAIKAMAMFDAWVEKLLG